MRPYGILLGQDVKNNPIYGFNPEQLKDLANNALKDYLK